MIAGLAFRNVLRNKERSLLTLVGVVLAIGSFVALVSLATGFTRRVERELESRRVDIYVTAGRGSTLPASPLAGAGGAGQALPLELEAVFRETKGVRSVTPIIRTSLETQRSVIPVIVMPLKDARVVFKDAQFNPQDLGTLESAQPPVSATAQPTSSPVLAPTPEVAPTPTPSKADPKAKPSGKPAGNGKPGATGKATPKTQPTPVSTPDATPIASPEPLAPLVETEPAKLAPALVVVGKGLNKEIEATLMEGSLVVEEIPFQVGGSMGSDGFLDFMILAPMDRFMRQRSDRGVHEYWITIDDENNAQAVQTALQTQVDSFLEREKTEGDYAGARKIRVMNRKDYLESARDYLGYGWLLQFAVSMVGVLIAVTASMNTMLMSTYERLGEYATLRAVGASRKVIAMTIIYEAVFLNVTGGILGLLFGFLATGVLDKAVAILLEIPYPMAGVTPGLLLQALALSFFVGLVGAVIPIFIVNRIDMVAQLRKGM